MISKKKFVSAILAISIVAALAVGGTLAFLTDKDDPITNTFTMGNVNINLIEPAGDALATPNEFKVSPGTTVTKDPTVRVDPGSEASYLFVKVEEGAALSTYVDYHVDTNVWTLLGPDYPGVYYKTQSAIAADGTAASYNVLTGDNGGSVTIKDVAGMKTGDVVTLTFTAYAIQQAKFENNPIGAWTALQTQLAASSGTGGN